MRSNGTPTPPPTTAATRKLLLPDYKSAKPEDDSDQRALFLFSREKTDSAVRYKLTFPESAQGESLEATSDDLLLTLNGNAFNIWDGRNLEYLASITHPELFYRAHPQRTEAAADNHSWCCEIGGAPYTLAMKIRPYGDGNNAGTGTVETEIYCGTDLKEGILEIRQNESVYNMPDVLLNDQAGEVFSHSTLRSYRSINSPMYAMPLRLAALKGSAHIAPMIHSIREQKLPTPSAFDAVQFRMNSSAPAPRPGSIPIPYERQNLTNIPKLHGVPAGYKCSTESNIYRFQPRGKKHNDNNAADSLVFTYSPELKYFIRLWHQDSWENPPTDCRLGTSDMGYYPLTCQYKFARGEYKWFAPEMLATGKNGESVILQFASAEEMDSQDYGDTPIIRFDTPGEDVEGYYFSHWNRVPGKEGFAYWVTAGHHKCHFFLVDMVQKKGRLIQSWQRDAMSGAWFDPEHHWLYLPISDNTYEIHSLDIHAGKSTLLAHLHLHNEHEFAVSLPDGRYGGSPGCERFLCTVQNGVAVDMSTLAVWRNRPAEVLETLGGDADAIEALRQATTRWLIKMGYNPTALPPEPIAHQLPRVETELSPLFCDNSRVNFAATLFTGENDISDLLVTVNGVKTPQPTLTPDAQSLGQRRLELSVPLSNGQNIIEITPVDSHGNRGNTARFRTIRRGDSPSHTYIVALGVSDYHLDELDLKYAAKDARDITTALSRHLGGQVHSLVLTDAEVKDNTILDKVKQFLSAATPNDKVILYCAGHGMLSHKLEYYFATADTTPDSPETSGLSMDALVECLQNTGAQQRLLMLDTCHCGAIGEQEQERLALADIPFEPGVKANVPRGMKVRKTAGLPNRAQSKRYVEELFSTGSGTDGVNVLTAAGGAEFALESADCNNGLFTAAVIQVLRASAAHDSNQDGSLSVDELTQAVRNKVMQLTHNHQRPTAVTVNSKTMTISQHKIPESSLDERFLVEPRQITPYDIMLMRMQYIATGHDHLLKRAFAEQIEYVNEGKTMNREEFAQDFTQYTALWPTRVYKVFALGDDNRGQMEILLQFKCTSPTGKQVSGYSKVTLSYDKQGKICRIHEQTSRRKAPTLSKGFRKCTNGYLPVYFSTERGGYLSDWYITTPPL